MVISVCFHFSHFCCICWNSNKIVIKKKNLQYWFSHSPQGHKCPWTQQELWFNWRNVVAGLSKWKFLKELLPLELRTLSAVFVEPETKHSSTFNSSPQCPWRHPLSRRGALRLSAWRPYQTVLRAWVWRAAWSAQGMCCSLEALAAEAGKQRRGSSRRARMLGDSSTQTSQEIWVRFMNVSSPLFFHAVIHAKGDFGFSWSVSHNHQL